MSPRRIARLLALFGTIALMVIVVVTVMVVRKRSVQQKMQTVAAIVPGALLHAHNFNWTQMRGDRSQWVLKAKDASYSNDKTSIILVEPRLSMTAQNGKHLSLTASRAVLKVHNGPGLNVAGIGLSGRPKAQVFQLLKRVTTVIDEKRRPAAAKAS